MFGELQEAPWRDRVIAAAVCAGQQRVVLAKRQAAVARLQPHTRAVAARCGLEPAGNPACDHVCSNLRQA
jgi:hypothetical protein